MNRILITLLCLLPLSLTATADDNHVELLTNGACDGTFDGWDEDSGDWAIEKEDDGTYSWVSSHNFCTFRQTINLTETGITTDSIDNGKVWLEASAEMRSTYKYNGMGARTARITVEMYDAEDKVLNTETLFDDTQVYESWTTFIDIFQLAPGTRKLVYLVEGQDAVKWAGNFGPRFRNLSLTTIDPPFAPVNNAELLTNGACDGTFNGWEASTGDGYDWAIATEDDGTYSWVSSYDICTLRQTIDLTEKNITTDSIDNGEAIPISSRPVPRGLRFRIFTDVWVSG